MISRLWSGESPFWRLLLPFSWIYGMIGSCIRLYYKFRCNRSKRVPVPVVVVGNLTAGGNGKTPVVIWLVEQLKKHGIRVGVVSRGYGGKSKHYPLLVNGYTTPAEAGDEPILIYQRTGVPVAVSAQRSKAILALLSKYALQMVIADDGLQHYAMDRDIEIVVVDGVRRFGNGWWLPAGPMRERSVRLRSVDAIIVNGGVAENEEIDMQLRSKKAVNMLTGEKRDVSKLSNLVAMAGIGYPERFFATLDQCGASLIRCISLSDHKALSSKKVNELIQPGQALIMTEKDAVKYRPFAKRDWWYLPVDAELNRNKSEHLIRNLISLTTK